MKAVIQFVIGFVIMAVVSYWGIWLLLHLPAY